MLLMCMYCLGLWDFIINYKKCTHVYVLYAWVCLYMYTHNWVPLEHFNLPREYENFEGICVTFNKAMYMSWKFKLIKVYVFIIPTNLLLKVFFWECLCITFMKIWAANMKFCRFYKVVQVVLLRMKVRVKSLTLYKALLIVEKREVCGPLQIQ